MAYRSEQVKMHKTAAKKVEEIIGHAFQLIAKGMFRDELGIKEFIVAQYRKNGLVSDRQSCIVAFNENSALPHYYLTNNRLLARESLILIDAWAKVKERGAPYADVTKVAYYGKRVPKRIKRVFRIITCARDSAVDFLGRCAEKGKLPTGRQVDAVARGLIAKKGFKENFIHGTGHSLGLNRVHGNTRLGRKNKKKIAYGVAYAVEPGIYFKKGFGMRSEVDIFFSKGGIEKTTGFQKKVLLIKP